MSRLYYLRWLWAEVRHALVTAGYWARPYDMLADARRWRWTPQTCCRCGQPAWRRTHPCGDGAWLDTAMGYGRRTRVHGDIKRQEAQNDGSPGRGDP